MMKPFVSAFNAWTCVVISVFAIVILSVLAHLFRSNSRFILGSTHDPDPAIRLEVASSLTGAVFVYIGFLLCCGSQAWLHYRASQTNRLHSR